MNPTQHLHQAGQSLWLDSINPKLLDEGNLGRYIEELAVTGLTSNPTNLGHSMAASSNYDHSLRRHLDGGVTRPEELVYSVALEDLGADLRRRRLRVGRGPARARLRRGPKRRAGPRIAPPSRRPNLLVKILGTPPGLAAMERLVSEGSAST